nr:hypothetical protein GCM10017611_58380 [Rhodococcus wratislaviensis]
MVIQNTVPTLGSNETIAGVAAPRCEDGEYGYSPYRERSMGSNAKGGKMSAVSKAMYKPLALAASVAGGIAASAVFGQVWKRVAGESEAPDPKDLSRSTREVLIAAAVQGTVFGLVKAAVDRAGAQGYRKLAHADPR